jgi:hypothetical protein
LATAAATTGCVGIVVVDEAAAGVPHQQQQRVRPAVKVGAAAVAPSRRRRDNVDCRCRSSSQRPSFVPLANFADNGRHDNFK